LLVLHIVDIEALFVLETHIDLEYKK